MRTLQTGDTGTDVRYLQRLLSDIMCTDITVDGIFGPETGGAVEAFQATHGLYQDGIVGPVTWEHLHAHTDIPDDRRKMEVVRVRGAQKYRGDGYTSFRLREDAAEALKVVQDDLTYVGGHLTSSGGLRGLSASVNANRSATSMHYVGRAMDLYVYSAMVDPHEDPFVVTRDPEHDRKFIVWARCEAGVPKTLEAVTYEKADRESGYPQVLIQTEGRFINFTELMRQEGFERISCRRSFLRYGKKNNGGAEWWHFQYERGLVEGKTTFGSELLRLYRREELEHTAPWKYRHHVFGVNWH